MHDSLPSASRQGYKQTGKLTVSHGMCMGIICVKIRSRTTVTSLRDFTWGRLLERGQSKYRSKRLQCGVKHSLHARFHGDRPGSFGVIDVTDRQTDKHTNRQTDRQTNQTFL